MRFPILGKALALGGVLVGLVLGLDTIEGVVRERQARQAEAEQGVADSRAGEQTLLGPVMHRHCVETWDRVEGEGSSRRTVNERRDFVLTAWPQQLDASVQVGIEPLHRGLFQLNSYLAQTEVKAQWASLDALKASASQPGGQVTCDAPVVSLALSDARGIQSAQVQVEGTTLAVRPGSQTPGYGAGFHAVWSYGKFDAPVRLQLTLAVAGTRGLAFVPVGDDTRVQLASNWAHPSFGGRFLPAERQISSDQFRARWQVSALATTARHTLLNGAALCDPPRRSPHAALEAAPDPAKGCVDSFGVAFIDPVNPYVLSDRAAKYGLLFIVLTFVGVGLMEVLRRLRVHPVQYLLVGSALTLFFLLLVSLSEHMAFGWAYLGASTACGLLLTYYALHVLRGWWPGLGFGAGIAGLYGALYALLQMEQTAMVLGSVLLFIVLAVVMVATRRLDWYALMAELRQPAQPVTAE